MNFIDVLCFHFHFLDEVRETLTKIKIEQILLKFNIKIYLL